VTLTTSLVLLLAALAAVFFSLVDLGIRSGLSGILSRGPEARPEGPCRLGLPGA
jgi:hypothetical protein